MTNRIEFGIVHRVPGVMRAMPAIRQEFERIYPAIEAALNARRNDGPPGVGSPYGTWKDEFRLFPEERPEGVSDEDFKVILADRPGAHFRLVTEAGIATAWRKLAPGFQDHSAQTARDLWAPLLLAYAVLQLHPEKAVGKELARDVRALPPALLSIFRNCGDPTAENLSKLVSEVPADERGNLPVIRAVRILSTYSAREAALQWHRRKRHDREAAYLDSLLRIEDFPMPAGARVQ